MAVAHVGAEAFAKVDGAGLDLGVVVEGEDFVDAEVEDFFGVERAAEIEGAGADAMGVNDAAAVLGGEQADGGEGADDAVAGTGEGFEVDAQVGGDAERRLLADEFGLS